MIQLNDSLPENPHYGKKAGVTNLSVLIVGGGPGGLALACALQKRRISYLLLERASTLGNTFCSMASNTTFGPWLNNVLPYTRAGWPIKLRRTQREEYAQYLTEYALVHDLSYRTSVEVLKIAKEGSIFRVQTNRGEFLAQTVVNATGYFSNPFTPEFAGASESAIPQIHAAQLLGPNTVRQLVGGNRGRVLVVGKRHTAGEIVQTLYRSGYEVCLSHRSPIQYAPSSFLEACISPLTYLLEQALVKLPGAPAPFTLESRMEGGVPRRLLEWGLVRCYPSITRFERERVVFEDQQEMQFDLVVYATGYRPALNHLDGLITFDADRGPDLKDMESSQVPRLFFLGLKGLRTFRSQFLRGLREDAVYLADRLANDWLTRPAGERQPAVTGA